MNCQGISGKFASLFSEKTQSVARVTAVALGLFAIVLLAASSALLGMAMHPRFLKMGMAAIPSLAGFFLLTLSVGVVCCAAIAGAIGHAKR